MTYFPKSCCDCGQSLTTCLKDYSAVKYRLGEAVEFKSAFIERADIQNHSTAAALGMFDGI